MAERTDYGWDEPAEPPPRWRALLDRALHGRTGEYRQASAPPRTGHQRGRGSDPDGGYPPPGSPDYPRPVSAPGQPLPRRARPSPPSGRAAAPTPPRYGAPVSAPAYSEPVSSPAYREPVSSAGFAGPGYAPGPVSPAQLEWRQSRQDDAVQRAIATLRRDLGGPKVLAFANPKGGVHKTTATVLAAATIGSVRGRGVLAWDDNELRGTLGLRAGSARHARTIRHLIADLAEVEATGGYDLRERLDDYLRHAADGTYDVLAGEENPRFAQRLDQFTVRRVLELLRRTHDVICVDTGNNVESTNWQTVMQAADQLVVTTVPREDAAFTADWMLDLLYETGLGDLASEAVTLLSCATPGPQPMLEELTAHFASRTRAVVVVPYDPALESGSNIEHALLQPATKQAWLFASAVALDPATR